VRALASIAVVVAIVAAAASARADEPLPNAGSPSQTPSMPPIAPTAVRVPDDNVRSPDDTVRSPDDNVRSPDVDALGTMSIRHVSGISAAIDLALAHELLATGTDAYALTPSARVELVPGFAFDAVLPIAYQSDVTVSPGEHAAAIGNAMIGAAWLPANNRLVGLELRVAAPTSPTTGAGAIADTTVASPRVADPELYTPGMTSAELVADWRWRGDAWWLQVEGGAAEWWQPQPAGSATVLRATLAAGLHVTGWLDATASFVTRLLVVSRDSSDNFIHGGLVGLVAHGRFGDAALRVELPIDQAARDAHAITLGVILRLR
jgi:hypothetical protein